jgi:hypothetical protein
MTAEEKAQWVIDNRYPKSEKDKVSDFEMYHFIKDFASQHEWVKLALEELVQLKRWKDKHGKDEHYVRCVDGAWQKAFEAIDNLTKQNP